MCNFWSGIVTNDGRILWTDSVWSHENIVEKYGLRDDKLEDREFVRVEVKTDKNIYSYKPKSGDFGFVVDEEGTLPKWFRDNRKMFETECMKQFRKAFKTDKLFNRDDIRRFVMSLKKIRWLKPDGKPKKEWKVFYGDTWDAAEDAARDAAEDAARDAARDAAWSAAWDAAGDAAWDAAWSAAWDAAGDAAWDAAEDASLMTTVMMVSDLKYKGKIRHEKHVRERMEVWKKGYALVCDVNGKLYVYAKKETKP